MPMFAKNDKVFTVIGKKKEDLAASLSAGMYTGKIYETPRGTVNYELTPMGRYDNSKVIKAGIFAEAYDYITEYFDPIKLRLRKEMGMMNKMNVMFKGDPGTGKTHLACTIASEIVKKTNGIGVVIDDFMYADFDTFAENLRINDDPDRLVILILDEMEKNKSWVLDRAKFLGFLDGALSKPNVFIFATVNSTDDLPNFLIDRPGRFEKIYDFEFKDKDVLRIITKGIIPKEFKENNKVIDTIVDIAFANELCTIDHLRFFILDYLFRTEKKLPLPTIIAKGLIKKEGKLDSELAKVKAEIEKESEKVTIVDTEEVSVTTDSDKVAYEDIAKAMNKHLTKARMEVVHNSVN